MEQETAILGIDYGRARIGLAIAQAKTRMPRPLDTLVRVNRNEDMRRLREVVREHRVRQIVVGLPLRLDGTRGEMAEEAVRFAMRVRKQLGLPVEMMDERLTSWEAERLLEEQSGRVLHAKRPPKPARTGEPAGRGRPARGSQLPARRAGTSAARAQAISVDSMAATVILQDYLARISGDASPAGDHLT
jgi:putative holliday junction resolvase